jgi:hypothetical protein
MDQKLDTNRKKPIKGEHGGNRGGEREKKDERSNRSSQAAGKDPHRGDR